MAVKLRADWWTSKNRGYVGSFEEYVEYREHKKLLKLARTVDVKKDPIQKPRSPTHGMTEAQQYRYWYWSDPCFRLWERMRAQMLKWTKGNRRTCKIARICGYTADELRRHIESQFVEGMSWENFGDWHIDHIVPKNLFDPRKTTHVRECWSLRNLRPLWARDNVSRPKDGSDIVFINQ